MGIVIHSSRSRYEAFMKCPRYGYLQYHWGGKGIVKNGKNIFLITGNKLHLGLELIGKWLKAHKGVKAVRTDVLEGIIQTVTDDYFKELFPPDWKENGGGYDLSYEAIDDEGERREITEYEMQLKQQYTFDEQCALVEALLRVFCLRIVPVWMGKYHIVTVENDMAFPLTSGEGFEVIQSARVDWVLQEIESKDLFLVSFKGYRQFSAHEGKVASHDTQGLSESWAFDKYLETRNISKRIMGVKMVYFIKGARKETKRGNGEYEQNSPLLRGYRKLTEDGPVYAHSWFYPKPENDSGVGALGRSWDKIEIFKEGLEVGGIKGWIEKLDSGEIQPDCGDILEQVVAEPEVYLRSDKDINSWLRQTTSREYEIAQKLLAVHEQCGNEALTASEEGIIALDTLFPQNRAACHYYPGSSNDCPYIPICHGTEEEGKNPLEQGYEFRTPHHKAELVQIKGVTK